MQKPLILVTNDDGITAPGIRNLVEFMNEIGEVVVVAPNSPQSGKGHAITINATLTVEEIKLEVSNRHGGVINNIVTKQRSHQWYREVISLFTSGVHSRTDTNGLCTRADYDEDKKGYGFACSSGDWAEGH